MSKKDKIGVYLWECENSLMSKGCDAKGYAPYNKLPDQRNVQNVVVLGWTTMLMWMTNSIHHTNREIHMGQDSLDYFNKKSQFDELPMNMC